jgi:hypothetical protein
MIRASPELVGRCGMLDEVPPERDRCARNVDVGGLQRNPPQGPFHPGHLARVRDDARQAAPFLRTDESGPGQRVPDIRRAMIVESGDLRSGDVERHRPQRRIGIWRNGPLSVAAGHRHLAVTPRLIAQPRHGGQTVIPFGRERAELTARAEGPARALDEHLETPRASGAANRTAAHPARR